MTIQFGPRECSVQQLRKHFHWIHTKQVNFNRSSMTGRTEQQKTFIAHTSHVHCQHNPVHSMACEGLLPVFMLRLNHASRGRFSSVDQERVFEWLQEDEGVRELGHRLGLGPPVSTRPYNARGSVEERRHPTCLGSSARQQDRFIVLSAREQPMPTHSEDSNPTWLSVTRRFAAGSGRTIFGQGDPLSTINYCRKFISILNSFVFGYSTCM